MRGQKSGAAAVLLSLFLIFTQTGCLHTAYVSDKLNQTMAQNSGTLVAAPGTKLAELRRGSTLDIGAGVDRRSPISKRRTFQQSKRFDWQLPNSNLLFKDCNSYSIYTDEETGETVVDMQIGTAQKYLTWAEVKAEMYDIEQRLLDDGWQATVWRGESSSDRMRKKLENPDFTQSSDSMGDAGYKKGDVSFTFAAKRARGENKPNIAKGENFTHYVLINDTAYETKRDRQLEEDRRKINEQLRQKEAEQNQSQRQNR